MAPKPTTTPTVTPPTDGYYPTLLRQQRHPRAYDLVVDDVQKLRASYGRAVEERAALLALLGQAYDRFTDNDMVPPNTQLTEWLRQAEALLLQTSENHP